MHELVRRHGADEEWDKVLSEGRSGGSGRILTVDLEKLWLKPAPILFIGVVKDVVTKDPDNYIVIVQRRWQQPRLGGDLRLRLTCSKPLFDAFIEKNPNLGDRSALNSVAFIARVTAIRTETDPQVGKSAEARVGVADCVDIGPILSAADLLNR